MKQTSRTLFVTALSTALLFGAGSSAQSPKRRTKAPAVGYLQGPFMQESATSFGPGFRGNDIKGVISIFKRTLPGPKSEFETTAGYAARIASFKASQPKFIFVLDPGLNPISSDDFGKLEYDADRQLMSRTITLSPGHTLGFRSDNSAIGQYIASNAFGVHSVVRRYKIDEFGLVVKEKSDLIQADDLCSSCEDEFTTWSMKIAFPIAVADAAALKDDLRIAFVCTVVGPRLETDNGTISPTITEPQEIQYRKTRLPVRIDGLFVFDSRTGDFVMASSGSQPASTESVSEKRIHGGIDSGENGSTTASHMADMEAAAVKQSLSQPINPAPAVSETRTKVTPRRDWNSITDHLQKIVDPVYPPLARQGRIQGTVCFNALIGRDGRIFNLQLVSGHPLLVSAAQDSVRQFLFTPFHEDGEARDLSTRIDITFFLDGKSSRFDVHFPLDDKSPTTMNDDLLSRAVSPAVLVTRTEPEYSPEAKKAKLQGTVVLFATVGIEGVPTAIRVIRQLGLGLDEAASKAVAQWRYRPAMKGGRPVESNLTVEVNFRLFD